MFVCGSCRVSSLHAEEEELRFSLAVMNCFFFVFASCVLLLLVVVVSLAGVFLLLCRG